MRCPIANGDGSESIATDFYLAFSPEREDPATNIRSRADSQSSRRHKSSQRRAAAGLYTQIVSKVIPVSSTRAAEMVKFLEDIFRCVNIALVNELKQLCLRMNLDIFEIIDSAATKPFGFMPFYPGPGLGGHCIPVDPDYLPGRLANTISPRASSTRRRSEHSDALPRGGRSRDRAQRAQKSIKGSKILLPGMG